MNFNSIIRFDKALDFSELKRHCDKACELLTWLDVETGHDETITIAEPDFQVAVLSLVEPPDREDKPDEPERPFETKSALRVTHTGGFFLNTLANSLEEEGYELEIEEV